MSSRTVDCSHEVSRTAFLVTKQIKEALKGIGGHGGHIGSFTRVNLYICTARRTKIQRLIEGSPGAKLEDCVENTIDIIRSAEDYLNKGAPINPRAANSFEQLLEFAKEFDAEQQRFFVPADLNTFAIEKLQKRCLVIFSGEPDGIEALNIVATSVTLTKCGLKVIIAGFTGENAVECAVGVLIKPKMKLEKAIELAEKKPFDVIILPGGTEGPQSLRDSTEVRDLLQAQEKSQRWIGAICGGPLVLLSHSIGLTNRITAHVTTHASLGEGYNVSSEPFCVDGHLITSQGPGTVYEFALAVAKEVTNSRGPQKSFDIRKDLAIKDLQKSSDVE